MKAALVALALIGVFLLLAPFLCPYSPYEQDRDNVLRPPLYRTSERTRLRLAALGSDGRRHLYGTTEGKFFLMGTDALGRDLAARIFSGARISLGAGLLGTALTLLIGSIVGLAAALRRGWIESLSMEAANFLLALPNLFVVLGLRALFPWDVTTIEVYLLIVGLLALTGWADVARVVRAKTLHMKSEQYLQAAYAAGCSQGRILWRHLLPGLVPYWLAQGSLLVPAFLVGEATLSFLGAGIPEPDASLGNILRPALSWSSLQASPWILSAGAVIVVFSLGWNALGERLYADLPENRSLGRKSRLRARIT